MESIHEVIEEQDSFGKTMVDKMTGANKDKGDFAAVNQTAQESTIPAASKAAKKTIKTVKKEENDNSYFSSKNYNDNTLKDGNTVSNEAEKEAYQNGLKKGNLITDNPKTAAAITLASIGAGLGAIALRKKLRSGSPVRKIASKKA
jgi:hypothetical protein